MSQVWKTRQPWSWQRDWWGSSVASLSMSSPVWDGWREASPGGPTPEASPRPPTSSAYLLPGPEVYQSCFTGGYSNRTGEMRGEVVKRCPACHRPGGLNQVQSDAKRRDIFSCTRCCWDRSPGSWEFKLGAHLLIWQHALHLSGTKWTESP